MVTQKKAPDRVERLAVALAEAWRKYFVLFGDTPHGTKKQFEAMLELLPKNSKIEFKLND